MASVANVIQFARANPNHQTASWSAQFLPMSTEAPVGYLMENQSAENHSDSFNIALQEPYFDAQREVTKPNSRPALFWTSDQLAANKFGETIKQMVSLPPPMNANTTEWSPPVKTLDLPPDGSQYYPQQQQHLQEPPVDQFNRLANLIINPNIAAPHQYITSSLFHQPGLAAPLPPAEVLNAISQNLVQRAGIIRDNHILPILEQNPFRHNSFLLRAPNSTKSPWFKSFATKRRSYEQPSNEQQSNMPRIESVSFDDTVEVPRLSKEHQHVGNTNSRGIKEYLTSYTNLPLFIDTTPTMEKKNMKGSSSMGEEDYIGSHSDGMFAVAGKTPSYGLSHYYPAYPYSHGHHIVAPRKGLEKSLGLSILVGIGAALISFLIISNLFLSVPLFAMTLLQLLQGNNVFPNNMMPSNNMMPPNNNMMPPNNNNNQNTPPNNQNQNGNGQSTNGRKRRDVYDVNLEKRVRKAIGISYI